MKETGISFHKDMIAAIDAGNKTMTRRLIKPQPKKQGAVLTFCKNGPGSVNASDLTAADMEIDQIIEHCRYGAEGDLLYIRESWFPVGVNGNKVLIGHDVHNANDTNEITVASERIIYYWDKMSKGRVFSPRFMPKEVARKWLLVKEIGIEPLQGISKGDAIREGIDCEFDTYRDYSHKRKEGSFVFTNPIDSFRSLWEKINGKANWEANPFVFVIRFHKIENPDKHGNL